MCRDTIYVRVLDDAGNVSDIASTVTQGLHAVYLPLVVR